CDSSWAITGYPVGLGHVRFGKSSGRFRTLSLGNPCFRVSRIEITDLVGGGISAIQQAYSGCIGQRRRQNPPRVIAKSLQGLRSAFASHPSAPGLLNRNLTRVFSRRTDFTSGGTSRWERSRTFWT